MTTSNGFAQQAPLYVRALRLRHLHVGGFVSFLLFECMIAAGVLLALAELVSWWAVPVLPAVVAIMVKVNDMVIGGSRKARALARGSSERASSTRVDPDDRSGETPSVPRRTTTALDRAEIARAGRTAARGGSSAPAGTSGPAASGAGGTGAGVGDAPAASGGAGAPAAAPVVRTRTVEPPAQRKKVGVIKISVPPKDAASRHAAEDGKREVVDAGYGISPASDDVPPPLAGDAPAVYASESAAAYASESAAYGSEPSAVYGSESAAAYGSDSSGRYGADASGEYATGSSTVYASDTAAPHGSGAAPYASGSSAPYASGSSAPYASNSSALYASGSSGSYAEESSGSHALAEAGEEWTDTDSRGFQRSRPLHPSEWSERPVAEPSGWSDRPAQDPWAEQAPVASTYASATAPEWPTETNAWGDRAAWSATAGSGARAQANWGDETSWGDRAAWGQAAQYSSGAGDWDDETGFADQAAWGTPARSSYGSGSWDGYTSGEWEPGAPGYAADYTGETTGPQQAARDLAARGEAYRSGETTGGHRRYDEEQNHGNDTRPLNREAGGRHARQQPPPPGRRRSEETDGMTSGHFTTGRHADRAWRSEDELARQRTGGINQGRFA